MKFDAPVTRQSDIQQRETRLRAGVSVDDFVFVAGSTRPGEERMLTEVYNKLGNQYDNFRMIIAPRHIERVGEITEELDRVNVQWCRFASDNSVRTVLSKCNLIIVDTLGQLNDIYHIANLAFVGGTMVPIGGHNLLEPVWVQTPVLFGPYVENVREAAAYITEHDYGMQVDGVEQLTEVVGKVYIGQRKFALKQESDMSDSATARIGTYLLEMLDNA
jgi:tRNA (guanine-N7-)-methyltransferase